MTGFETYLVLGVGIVFGWCANEIVRLWQRPSEPPSQRRAWRQRHASHVATTRKLRAGQGGKPAA